MSQDTFKKLQEPFPDKAYKKVEYGRGFTSIDAYYIVERFHTVFDDWGMKNLEFSVHEKPWKDKHGDSGITISVSCVGELWAKTGDDYTSIWAVGAGTVIKGDVAEAYKKAQTNMLSKASSYWGVGLDVYKGEHQDDPYLDRTTSSTSFTPPPTPEKESWDDYNIGDVDPDPPSAWLYKPDFKDKDKFKKAAFEAKAYAKWDTAGKCWVCKAEVPGWEHCLVR